VVVKPIALKAKEGFDILMGRSKSTPPIPREQIGKQPPLHPDVPPQTGDYNTSGSTPLPVEAANKKTDVPYLDLPIPPMNPLVISGPDTQPPGSQPQTPMHHSPIPQPSTSSSPHLTGPIPSQNTPSTSLEAYLLERKRRGVSGGGVTPRIVTPTPGVKGKGFKSSPLTPTEREIADGAKSKGISDEARGGDGSTLEK